MATYIRPLTIDDLDQCVVVESAAFPPAEAASREKIDYRLSVCPELCLGLFVREGTEQTGVPRPETSAAGTGGDRLIAHVISTRTTSRVVRDEDMTFPPAWRTAPAPATAPASVGHDPTGRTVALHSLAVAPDHQRSGFGSKLMAAYAEYVARLGQTDRIAILTYDRLVPYYQKLGFTHYGKSESEYAGVAWHDLAYEYQS